MFTEVDIDLLSTFIASHVNSLGSSELQKWEMGTRPPRPLFAKAPAEWVSLLTSLLAEDTKGSLESYTRRLGNVR